MINYYKRVLKLQKEFQEILVKDGGLRTFCDRLREEIDNRVLILNSFHDDLIYGDREIKQNHSLLEAIFTGEVEKLDQEIVEDGIVFKRYIYKNKDNKIKIVEMEMKSDEERYGYMVIIEESPLKEEDYPAIIQAAYALSVKIHQNHLVQKLVQKSSNDLIDSLLNGTCLSKEEIVQKGELAGWDLNISYQLFVFRYRKLKGNKVQENYEIEEEIIRNIHRIIKTNISRKYIIFSYQGQILLLINYKENIQDIKQDINLIFEKLLVSCKDVEINVAAGTFLKSCCCKINNSYREALNIHDFLEASGQWNKILFYDDLGILSILWKVELASLKRYVDEFIQPLIIYDQENNTDWLQTLGIYLETGGSIQTAAKKLHIHPNSVSYRINRIGEILEMDLHNFDNRLNLSTAYKIYTYILKQGGVANGDGEAK
ncbi:MAG: PucR family transcriptional regulator [Halanaerobiales bacterium]